MLSEKMIHLGNHRSVIRELFEYGNRRAAEIGRDNIYDFSLGNPSTPPPPSVEQTIRHMLDTESAVALHGYTSAPGAPAVRKTISEDLQKRFGEPARPENLYMTAGAAASLCICFHALLDAGDEVLSFVPYFPEYKVFVEGAGGVFRPVACNEANFQPDFDALEQTISEKTVAVIVNSPNNPSGAVFSVETVQKISDILSKAEQKYGHPIYLIADEPYRELVYENIEVAYLPRLYADTVVCYSYSKSLSLPGERIGYIYVPDRAARSADVMAAVQGAGRCLGYVCAPSLFQRVVAACQGQTADMTVYKTNRELLYTRLTALGFQLVRPEGAFYIFMKTPEPDANAFSMKARDYELLLVPGDDFGMPGYVRLAYCVDTAMITRSLPAFEKLAAEYHLTKEN